MFTESPTSHNITHSFVLLFAEINSIVACKRICIWELVNKIDLCLRSAYPLLNSLIVDALSCSAALTHSLQFSVNEMNEFTSCNPFVLLHSSVLEMTSPKCSPSTTLSYTVKWILSFSSRSLLSRWMDEVNKHAIIAVASEPNLIELHCNATYGKSKKVKREFITQLFHRNTCFHNPHPPTWLPFLRRRWERDGERA